MITSINKSTNKDLYDDLFARAQTALKNEGYNGVIINSLETYFARIKDLAEIDMKYTILPLDEPALEIDTNKRTITIPKDSPFNKLVGVIGDHTAETIYFKVDRYFDFTDLATQGIYIEWRRVGDEAEEDHVSPIYIMDAVSEPNKLIFGWMITEEMTSKAGIIEFAIRFFSFSGETIHYSLGTLPAQIKISDTMQVDSLSNVISEENFLNTNEIQSMIKNRLVNSHIYGGETSGIPIILVNLIDKYTFIDWHKTSVNINNTQDYVEVDLEDANGEDTRLIFLGQSPDTGTLSYIWYYAKNEDEKDPTLADEFRTIEAENSEYGVIDNKFYLETFDKEYVKGKKYFTKDENSEYIPWGYQYFPPENEDSEVNNDTILYEEYASFLPITAGKFKATVTNTVGVDKITDSEGNIIQDSIPVNPSPEQFSRTVIIPGAELIVHKDEAIVQFADSEDEDSTTFVVREDNLETNLPEKGKVYYIWTDEEGTPLNGEDGQESPEFEVSNFGKYYVTIKHVRNNNEKLSEPALYRFSQHGQAFNYSHSYGSNLLLPLTTSLQISVTTKDGLTDKGKIEWYSCSASGILNDSSEYTDFFENTDFNDDNMIELSYTPVDTGYYTFVLTNTYSGEDHTIQGPIFSIYGI